MVREKIGLLAMMVWKWFTSLSTKGQLLTITAIVVVIIMFAMLLNHKVDIWEGNFRDGIIKWMLLLLFGVVVFFAILHAETTGWAFLSFLV